MTGTPPTKSPPAESPPAEFLPGGDSRPLTLDAVRDDCRRRLADGATRPRAPFRLAILATDGGPAAARMVVLRQATFTPPTLAFHTDRRSPKCIALATDPDIALVFHDPGACIQLRVAARTTLHCDDAAAEAAWRGTPPASRLPYLAEAPPGTPVDGPTGGLPDGLAGRPPEETLVGAGRKNFALVVCAIRAFDWLRLAPDGHPAGHRRAAFDWNGSRFTGRWLTP